MIAKKYYSENIPISLRTIVYSYNSACPSYCSYSNKNSFPYLISSTILFEVLLKKIILKVSGRYRGVHIPKQLLDSLESKGVPIRKLSKEELNFVRLDHSYIRYNAEKFLSMDLDEEVLDGLFEYFLDLAISLGVE